MVDHRKTSEDWTWAFVFQLPSQVTEKQERALHKVLKKQDLTTVRLLEHLFGGVRGDQIEAFLRRDHNKKGPPTPVNHGFTRGLPDVPSQVESDKALTSRSKLKKAATLHSMGNYLQTEVQRSRATTLNGTPDATPFSDASPEQHMPSRSFFKSGLQRPLLPKALSKCSEYEEPSLSSTQHCVIELLLALFREFNRSAKEALVQASSINQAVGTAEEGAAESEGGVPGGQAQAAQKLGPPVRVLTFTSVHADELFVCISLRGDIAELIADVAEYPVQLAPNKLERIGIEIKDPETVPAYVKYDSNIRDLCKKFPHAELGSSVIRKVDTIRILYDRIFDFANIPEMEVRGLILHSFPLHDLEELERLRSSWGSFRLMLQMSVPISEIRDYFGEEIAFYFLFMQSLVHAASCLAVIAACIGVLSFFSEGFSTAIVHTSFSLLVILWYMIFWKLWRRCEAQHANLWGTDGEDLSDIRERLNPRFQGELAPSAENAKIQKPRADSIRKLRGRCLANILSALFVLVMLAAIGMNRLLVFRYTERGDTFAEIRAAVGLSVQIQVFNFLWSKLAEWIGDFELRERLSSWHSSLFLKAFVVNFINSFVGIAFTAFVQPCLAWNELAPGGAARLYGSLLRNTLIGVLVTGITVGTMNNVMTPFAFMYGRIWLKFKNRQQAGVSAGTGYEYETSYQEQQAKMNDYDRRALNSDYLEILMLLGFVLFFGIVFPVAAILMFLALLLQLRADAWKLCHAYRRPYPQRACNIGFVNNVLGTYFYFAVISNVSLTTIFFMMDGIIKDRATAVAFFSSSSLALIMLQQVVRTFMGESSSLRMEKRRQAHQRHHLYFSDFSRSAHVKMQELRLDGEDVNRNYDHIKPLKLQRPASYRYDRVAEELLKSLPFAVSETSPTTCSSRAPTV